MSVGPRRVPSGPEAREEGVTRKGSWDNTTDGEIRFCCFTLPGVGSGMCECLKQWSGLSEWNLT